jgi:hypothetical protein
MNDALVDTCLQMLPVVCIGGNSGFELETHALAAADEPLFDVRVKGLEPAYQEVSSEEIEDVLYRVIAVTQIEV